MNIFWISLDQGLAVAVIVALSLAAFTREYAVRRVVNLTHSEVLDKKLSILQGDTERDPVEGKTALVKLLSGGGIAGIIGPTPQGINTVKPVLVANKIIDEFHGGATGGDTGGDRQTDPYLFRDSPSDSQLGVAMATYAYMKRYERADLLVYADAAAQTIVAPAKSTFIKLGGTVIHTYIIIADQSSYTNTVAQVISDTPQVVSSQTDAPTVAVLSTEFSQLGSTFPWIGTDVTTSSDSIKAIGTARTHSTLTSVVGTSLTGTANNVFVAGFKTMFPSQAAPGPLSGANHADDAVISSALANTYANTFNGPTVAVDMTQVTDPPGTACYSFTGCVSLLKAQKKINYEGASGSINCNKYHNTIGPHAPFVADATTGNEVQGAALSAKVLGDVTNCTTTASCVAVLKADGIK